MHAATGVVPLEGRGDLPFLSLHREPLFLHSVRTLIQAARVGETVVTVDPGQHARAQSELARHRLRVHVEVGITWWTASGRSQATSPTALLDPLCPLVPVAFVDGVLARVPEEGDSGVAGFRPVTDTIKTVVDHRIAGTIDRDEFAIISSPVVIPARVTAQSPPPVHDFAVLAAWLRERGRLVMVKAPSMARRVDDDSAVSLLECVDEISRTVQES